jgi:hypothetical protein
VLVKQQFNKIWRDNYFKGNRIWSGEVFTATIVSAQLSLTVGYWCFEGACFLHLQIWRWKLQVIEVRGSKWYISFYPNFVISLVKIKTWSLQGTTAKINSEPAYTFKYGKRYYC